MTLGEYITTIHEITRANNVDIVTDLLYAAEAGDFSDHSIERWLSPKDAQRHQNPRPKKYFNDDHPFNETGFINYLKDQIKESWRNLQEAFIPINDEHIVNTETDNEDLFYESLLNQFKRIFGVPLPTNPPDLQNNSD